MSLASRRMAVRLVADKEDVEDLNLCIALAEILPIPSADWTKVRKTRGLVTPVRRWIVAISLKTPLCGNRGRSTPGVVTA